MKVLEIIGLLLVALLISFADWLLKIYFGVLSWFDSLAIRYWNRQPDSHRKRVAVSIINCRRQRVK